VDACRPWDRRESFAPIAAASPELLEAATKKWGHLLDG
jgi:hypothetical protein